MSQAKLNSWEAQNIARSISEKAFDHVIGPIDNKINELLRAGYANTLSSLGVSSSILAEHGIGELADKISVEIKIDGRTYKEQIKGDTNEFISVGRYCRDFVFVESEITAEYIELRLERAPFRTQQNALANELSKQMTGRSAKAVMKAWPEAANFIAAYFNIVSPISEMTSPLEVLLAKYLPMLAAPQGV